jgi:hypothetical protein
LLKTNLMQGQSLQKIDAIERLVGAIVLENNDEWAARRSRYMTLETVAAMSDDPLISVRGVPIAPCQ